jgi:hypothetical protein
MRIPGCAVGMLAAVTLGAVLTAAPALKAVQSETPAAEGPAPVVYLVEVDGIIHPVAAEYIRGALGQADAAGAAWS